MATDLAKFGRKLRALRKQTGLTQRQLAESLDSLAQSGPAHEYRVVDETLISRWETARAIQGRQWKPTRSYVLHLIRFFVNLLEAESAHAWALAAGYHLSLAELEPFFPGIAAGTPIDGAPRSLSPSLSSLSSSPLSSPSSTSPLLGQDNEVAALVEQLVDRALHLMIGSDQDAAEQARAGLSVALSILTQIGAQPELDVWDAANDAALMLEEFDGVTVKPPRFAGPSDAGATVMILAPDVALAFPTAEAANQALRLVLALAAIPAAKPA